MNTARALVAGMIGLGSAAWLGPSIAGCALTSRGDAIDVRTFTPESPRPRVEVAEHASGPALRFGRVRSGPDLGQRIVHGDGAFEVSYYEDLQWTERPELYVRRGLDRTLFEERGFKRELTGEAPTLEVEVLAFEEVKTPSKHAARIVLRVVIATDHVLLEDTVAVMDPVEGPRFDDVVAAMSRALDASCGEVARRVGAVLSTPVVSAAP